MLKIVFIILGTLSLLLGILGIVVPGLPSTPFFLLTAGLYMRSSERITKIFLSNRVVSAYISDYIRNRGMTFRAKIWAIGLMTAMVAVSVVFFLDALPVRMTVVIAGLAGLAAIIFIVPDAGNKEKE